MTDEQQDEQFYRDTESVAFPKLNDHQLSLLEPLGERRLVIGRGELVYKAGQRDLGLTILLRGEIEAFEQRDDGTEQILATAHERDFIGDVAMLQGTSALASASVTSPDAEILLRSRGRTAPRSGRDARSQQDDRRCVDHAAATDKPVIANLPECAFWLSRDARDGHQPR